MNGYNFTERAMQERDQAEEIRARRAGAIDALRQGQDRRRPCVPAPAERPCNVDATTM